METQTTTSIPEFDEKSLRQQIRERSHMLKPDSIVEIDISILDNTDVSEYDSYVYEYEVLEGSYIGCKYPGSHLMKDNEEIFDGSYWQSSKNEKFKDLFSTGVEMKLTLIDVGIYQDMLNLEHEMKNKEKDITNPKYFNKAVTKKGFNEPLNREVDRLIYEEVKEFDKLVPNPLNVTTEQLRELGLNVDFIPCWNNKVKLEKAGFVQVRELESSSHISEIAGYMRDKGDAIGANYILRWASDGRIGNGNCTLKAGLLVDTISQMKVIDIPESYEKQHNLTDRDKRHIGNMFNKKAEIVTDEIDEGDVIKDLIYDYEHSNIPFNSVRNKIILKEDYGFNGQTANAICNHASIEYAKKQQRSSHRNVINYTKKSHPKNYQKMMDEKKKLSDSNTRVIEGSSGGWKTLFYNITKEVIDHPDTQHFKALIYHGDNGKNSPIENKVKWEGNNTIKGKREKFEPVLRDIIENRESIHKIDQYGKPFEVKRTFEVRYMPFDEADSSDGEKPE